MKKIKTAQLAVILGLAVAQPVLAVEDWIGTANYALAPGAEGDEATTGDFNAYDFSVGATLIRLGASSVSGTVTSGSFDGFYQTVVTDHTLAGSIIDVAGLDSTGGSSDPGAFELTLAARFFGTFSTDSATGFTSFTDLFGNASLYFDTTPDQNFGTDTGFENGAAILSGVITGGGGFVSDMFGIGASDLEISFSGLFGGGSFNTDVYDPDTIGGGTALFSILLDNQSSSSVTSAINDGLGTVLGQGQGANTLLTESDGSLSLTAVPLPAGIWLFGSSLIGFLSLSNRKRTS